MIDFTVKTVFTDKWTGIGFSDTPQMVSDIHNDIPCLTWFSCTCKQFLLPSLRFVLHLRDKTLDQCDYLVGPFKT